MMAGEDVLLWQGPDEIALRSMTIQEGLGPKPLISDLTLHVHSNIRRLVLNAMVSDCDRPEGHMSSKT
jgi:hypothetical protein